MNKKLIFAPLLVFAAGVLAACSTDTIVSRPDWKDQQIIDGLDVKDNQMKVIYDAVKNLGDTNSNVLNNILYKISAKNIGTIDELKAFRNKTFDNVDKEALKKFVSSHKIYQPIDKYLVENGKRQDKEMDEDDSLKVSFNIIQSQINEINENVYEKLYDDIKGGSYSVDNVFYEKRFISNLRKNLYDIFSLKELENATYATGGAFEAKSGVFTPRTKDANGKLETWSTYVNKYLNVNKEVNYIDENGNTIKKYLYKDYITHKIVPDIYRTYLIQTYVKEQRYSNIARSYARKVNMITIANGGTDYKESILKLMTAFAKTNIVKNENKFNGDFSALENAMKGYVGKTTTGSTYEALVNAGFETIKDSKGNDLVWKTKDTVTKETNNVTHVFKGTKLGDLIENKLMKIYTLTNNDTEGEDVVMVRKKDADQTAYNDLTNSGAYSVEEGLAIKEREIHTTSYTKQGWYLKNGGLSDLNSDIRERLFNIQTSNLVDTVTEDKYKDGDYIRNYKGNYYLTGSKSSTSEEANLIVLMDDSNYHIIQVEEAISTSKMANSDNSKSYMYKKSTTDKFASINAMNDIVYNVVKSASSGDTYKKNANQYYLMISNIIFYDQAVYDYFKSQYPDLFK